MARTKSEDLFARAQKVIPGGVNSPVRAFKGVGGTPVFFERAQGAYITDVDGNQYIDYVASWGPMLRGYRFQPIIDSLTDQALRATSFGAPTEIEVLMAELICERVASIERVRMVNSGTEATMSAIRLARGVTGRDKIVKFEGGFHGHGDSLLVKAGSGLLTLGLPDSPGVPSSLAEHTLTIPFNDLNSVDEVFNAYGDEIAAVIVEPIAGNMGCIPPVNGFLEKLRSHCSSQGALLIFDEVMTGFRVAPGGAQEKYAVTPDLTTLGKVIGGGLPVGAFGGKAEFMDQLAPAGPVYQSGTLSGNSLAMRAGYALLSSLYDASYEHLEKQTRRLTNGLRDIAQTQHAPIVINEVCAMFSVFFTDQSEVRCYSDVAACDASKYQEFFHVMLDLGIYLAPSAFESAFVSTAHFDEVIDQTLAAAEQAFEQLT